MAGESIGYRAWLKRRIEDGSDLTRVRAQIETWKAAPPKGTPVQFLDGMLAELDKGAGRKPRLQPHTPAPDMGGFE